MIKVKAYTAAALAAACLLCFSSCADKQQGVERLSGEPVLEITRADDELAYEVTGAEYDYYYNNYLAEGIGAEQAAQKTLDELCHAAAIISFAAENEIELDKDDRKAVEADIDLLISSFENREEYEQGLADFNMTHELYKSLSQQNALEVKLREYAIDEISGLIKSDDETVEADIMENFIAAKQILISNDEGDDVEQNRLSAESIYAELEGGADFDALVEQYGEDNSMDVEHGRYFTHGMFPDEFEQAALALEIGEHSGVIETEVGFHIILRMPISQEYVDDNFEQLRYYFLNRRFNELVDERASEMNVEYKK